MGNLICSVLSKNNNQEEFYLDHNRVCIPVQYSKNDINTSHSRYRSLIVNQYINIIYEKNNSTKNRKKNLNFINLDMQECPICYEQKCIYCKCRKCVNIICEKCVYKISYNNKNVKCPFCRTNNFLLV